MHAVPLSHSPIPMSCGPSQQRSACWIPGERHRRMKNKERHNDQEQRMYGERVSATGMKELCHSMDSMSTPRRFTDDGIESDNGTSVCADIHMKQTNAGCVGQNQSDEEKWMTKQRRHGTMSHLCLCGGLLEECHVLSNAPWQTACLADAPLLCGSHNHRERPQSAHHLDGVCRGREQASAL